MDVLPTAARLANAPLPARRLDGVDIWPMLAGEAGEVERDILLYFDSWHVQCARLGQWKLHVSRYNSVAWTPAPAGGRLNLPLLAPELYDLAADSQESCDVATIYPEIVADIRARLDRVLGGFPADVGDAWRDTMSREVDETPSGALPQLKNA
jgi:arylsulfatase A-like enzyme